MCVLGRRGGCLRWWKAQYDQGMADQADSTRKSNGLRRRGFPRELSAREEARVKVKLHSVLEWSLIGWVNGRPGSLASPPRVHVLVA